MTERNLTAEIDYFSISLGWYFDIAGVEHALGMLQIKAESICNRNEMTNIRH